MLVCETMSQIGGSGADVEWLTVCLSSMLYMDDGVYRDDGGQVDSNRTFADNVGYFG